MTPYEIPELFPQPKSISLLDDMSALSADVRLITDNVLPLQRKSIRTILFEAGVHVIANKKTYIIEAHIEENGEFNFAGVPEACREDYYELTIKGSVVTIRAQQQRGAVMAASTLASLYRLFLAGKQLPNMFIRDWPDMPVRGIMIDAVWGVDRMNLQDWIHAIDQLTVLKFNALGIGIYNCIPESTFEDKGTPAEFFSFAMPEHDELANVHHLNWYSAEKDVWNSEEYISSTVEKEDLLESIINYAKEKDLMVFPIFSLFGNNTLFPRMIPEISALTDKNAPSGKELCTYSRATREFITEMLDAFMKKYYPDGAPFVHIRMDDILEFCGCSKCRMSGHDEIASDYLLWLTKTLILRNVGKVIFWQDALIRNPRALESTFARKLFNAGLRDRAIIHWREASSSAVDKKNRVSLAKKTGLTSWAGPVMCEGSWTLYKSRRDNIQTVVEAAFADKAAGVVATDIYDVAHYDQLAQLSRETWNAPNNVKPADVLHDWAFSTFGENCEKYESIVNRLSVICDLPAVDTCIYAKYAVKGEGAYPKTALETLEGMDDAKASLLHASEEAQLALNEINELAAIEKLPSIAPQILKSLRAEAARVCALAETFAWMLELREELQSGMIMKRMNTAALKARDALAARMRLVEHNKPNFMTPAVMHPLSKLLAFIEQLTEELKIRAARKQAKLICWSLKESPSSKD